MKKIIYILVLLGISATAPAEERPILAVFDMEDRGAGLSKETLNNLTDYLAAMLTEGGYQIIPRTQIRERLKQQQNESYKECFDQSCQIELGKELAAQKSLSTKVLKIGKKCRVTGDLYDLKRAASEKAATAGSGCSEDELLAAVEEVAAKLTGKHVEPPPEEPIAAPERAESEVERRKREAAEERRKTLERFRAGQSGKAVPPPPSRPRSKPPAAVKPPVKVRRSLADYTWNITFKFGVLMPALAEDEGIEIDGTNVDTDTGIFVDSQIDLRLGPSLAVGAYLYFAHASGVVAEGSAEDFDFLSVGGRVKYVLIGSDRLAFRPYFGMGYGTFLSGATYTGEDSGQQVSLEGASGLNIALAIEAVYYITESLGVVIDFGLIAQGTGTKEQDGEEYDAMFYPLLFLTFGFEFGG